MEIKLSISYGEKIVKIIYAMLTAQPILYLKVKNRFKLTS